MNPVKICNSALIKIGEAPIQSLDDPQKSAVTCKERFDSCRKSVLEAHPWKFAKHRIKIETPLVESPAFGYENYFQLPADLVSVVSINDGDEAYDIEGDRLLYDGSVVEMVYIRDQGTPAPSTPLFDEALACYIGWDLANSLTEEDNKRLEMWERFQQILSRARFKDAAQLPAKEIEAETFFDARFARGYPRDPMT